MMKSLSNIYRTALRRIRRFLRGKEYHRIATFTPEEVLPHVLYGRKLQQKHREFQRTHNITPTPAQWKRMVHRKYCGQLIDMRAQKLRLFDQKGIVCTRCGIEGKHFALEKSRFDPTGRYHLRLYALDNQGKEILMTKDHTIPVSKGGSKSSLKNLQPMCFNCNKEKADKLEDPKIVKNEV